MPTTNIPVVEDLSWKYSACAEEAPTAQDQADSVPGRRLLRSPSCAMERAPLHPSYCTWPRGISLPQLWEVHTPPKQKAGICFPTIPEPCYGRFCFLGPTFSSRDRAPRLRNRPIQHYCTNVAFQPPFIHGSVCVRYYSEYCVFVVYLAHHGIVHRVVSLSGLEVGVRLRY